MDMFTDPMHLQVSDPGHIEGNTVFTYLDAFCEDRHFAEYLPDYANPDELKEHYQKGGVGDMKIKKFLNSVIQEELTPVRQRRKEYEKDIRQFMTFLKPAAKRPALLQCKLWTR